MGSPPTFVFSAPLVQPVTPETWSFTSLRMFDECPLKWALSKVNFPEINGPIPQKPSRRSLEGILLHGLIESYEHYVRKGCGIKFRPRKTLLGIIQEWSKSNKDNPRINSKALAGQVRLEELLRAFSEAASYINTSDNQNASDRPSTFRRPRVFDGAESWLKDPNSKLCGQADLISRGKIIDFKSGDKQEHHIHQIMYYAALYLEITGKTPNELRLIYTESHESIDVPLPEKNVLEALLTEFRQRVQKAEQQVFARDLPAKPDSTKCSYCHVRGICTKYWESIDYKETQQANVIDYTPTSLSVIESAALGVYICDDVAGTRTNLHLPQEVADKIGVITRSIRFLALRVIPGPKGVTFSFTQNSEVYVVDAGEHKVEI
jgi:CRISPR/Cas system-associated exonuclease Cas4 (RecB family)